jgi:hypothetical protein
MLLTHVSHPDPFEADGMPLTYDSMQKGTSAGFLRRELLAMSALRLLIVNLSRRAVERMPCYITL